MSIIPKRNPRLNYTDGPGDKTKRRNGRIIPKRNPRLNYTDGPGDKTKNSSSDSGFRFRRSDTVSRSRKGR